ncbi:hypothetical protein H4Q26_010234 [Puccinia striiformis f. sp. tritici PST-130]|nr:hypothetical protein H4Q26_010234 [Puccinia striiformis f. sp. tritici PST-130]
MPSILPLLPTVALIPTSSMTSPNGHLRQLVKYSLKVYFTLPPAGLSPIHAVGPDVNGDQQNPIPTNQHVPGLQGVSDMAIDPLFQPPHHCSCQAPIITPKSDYPKRRRSSWIHAVPPEPNSEDEIDPPSGHNTSKDEAFSVYGPRRYPMETLGHHVVAGNAPPKPVASQIITPNGAGPHVYGTIIRVDRGSSKNPDILMRSTLESYSRVQSVHGHPFVHSPLPLIKNFVLEQPAAFRRQHLLPGLPTNHSSMASLVTFLRAMVKHERTHMRNIILTNVRQEPFQPRTTMRSFQEIQADVTLGVRVRIAMLRLLTIHHLVHRAPGDTRSQWDLIDDHLEALREKSPLEMAVYSVLILRRDRELFPGNTMFGDVPAELIQLPNALESDIEMRAMVSELGPEPSDEQLTTSLAREVTLDE